MIGASRRYRELFVELLIERELASGSLPDPEESRYVDELDRCWWAMSADEQQAVEHWLDESREGIEAPTDLEVEDIVVAEGSRALPRKAA